MCHWSTPQCVKNVGMKIEQWNSRPHLRILHCSNLECSNALNFCCAKFGGGGGNRTPVRRFSAKYDYMLSRCFDLAPRAPNGWVSRGHPVWISASSPPAGESAYPTE